jgi:hypothetical protein
MVRECNSIERGCAVYGVQRRSSDEMSALESYRMSKDEKARTDDLLRFCGATLIAPSERSWSKHSERLEYQGQHLKSYASQLVMKDPYRPESGKASVGGIVLRMASNVPVQSSYIAAILTRIRWVAPLWYSPLMVIPLVLLVYGSIFSVCDNLGIMLAGYFLAYFAVYLVAILSCLSWNWRVRSSVKITERTHEKRKKALHGRRKSSHLEAAFAG